MLDRQRGDIVLECDGCAAVFNTETSDFGAAMNHAKREGWKPRRNDDGEWEHFCDRCA